MATITWSPSLTMDSALADEIIAAIRQLYPQVVAALAAALGVDPSALTDGQIGKAWVKYQVREMLTITRTRAAHPDPGGEVDTATRQIWAAVQAATDQARTDVDGGITL